MTVGMLVVVPTKAASAATGSLTDLSWSVSSTGTAAANVAYGFTLDTYTAASLTTITFGLPPGVGGAPSLVALTGETQGGGSVSMTGASAALSGSTLTVSFRQVYIPAATLITVHVDGLTNPGSPSTGEVSVTTISSAGTTIDTGSTQPVSFAATVLPDGYWYPSPATTGATGVSYTFGYLNPANSAPTVIRLSVPPGTGGSPALGSVTPASLAGATVALSGQELSVTLPTGATIAAGTPVRIVVTGLTNTGLADSYGEQITTLDGAGVLAATSAGAPDIAPGTLGSASWSASSTMTGAPGVTYTYSFTTMTGQQYQELRLGVPAGTTGTPNVVSVSLNPGYSVTASNTSVRLVANQLVFDFTANYLPGGTAIAVSIGGLTNTSVAGDYAAPISTRATNSPTYPVDAGVAAAVTFTSESIPSLSWAPSSTVVQATGVTYTYGLTLGSTATLDTITMSVPPGTGGTPQTGTVAPSLITGANSQLSFSGQTLTYTFPATTLAAGTNISIQVTGLTNPPTAGSYAAALTVQDAGRVVASGSTPAVTFTTAGLSALSWTTSSTTTGATGVTYGYDFTTGTGHNLVAFEMTVPAGTAGTPATPTADVYQPGQAGATLSGLAASLSGTTLTVTFNGTYLAAGTAVSVQVGGFTNTGNDGTYYATITTDTTSVAVDSGTTPGVTLNATALLDSTWSVSNTAAGATDVSYLYAFKLSGTATIDSISVTVPAGTAGTATVGPVRPTSIAAGTIARSANTLSYAFAATTLPANTSVSIQLNGFTNTATPGSYPATITIAYQGSSMASGSTGAVAISATTLASPTWSVDSGVTGAAGVTYTYAFTTASATTISSFTMSVPPATGGNPTLGSISVHNSVNGTVTLGGTPTLTFAGNTLTVSFGATYLAGGTAVTIVVTGMTNTDQAGSWYSVISTRSTVTVDTGSTPPVTITSTALESPTWTASSSGIGATNVSYTYSFQLSAAEQLSGLSITVPAGTGGTPTPTSAGPQGLAGGTATLTSGSIVYSFTPTVISGGTTVSITFGGLANTTTAGSYPATVTAIDQGYAVASGSTPSLPFTATVLSNVTWTVSSAIAGATGIEYDYGFTTASTAYALNTVTLSVPPGTGGTPTVVSVSATTGGLPVTIANAQVTLDNSVQSNSELALTFNPTYVASGTDFTVKIGGIVNTPQPTSYAAAVVTSRGATVIDSGTSAPVAIYAASVKASIPAALSWSSSLDTPGPVADSHAADQSFQVLDQTGRNAGWTVSVSATPFTSGSHVLAGTDRFWMTGSVTDPLAQTAPSYACLTTTCTAPNNNVTYPAYIPTTTVGTTTPIYTAATGTGSGSFQFGGSGASQPVGWWLDVPGNAYAGIYTSTITMMVTSGP